MITKTLDENTISLMPEDSDDLLTIRRILKIDDKIIGETTRVIKQDKEYARPDKGESCLLYTSPSPRDRG